MISQIDFILVIPELFMLTMVNIFLLYALFFERLGQSNQSIAIVKESETVSKHLSFFKQQHNIRTGYLSTPLLVVEPLNWLIVISLIFSVFLYINIPTNGIILTNSFICDTYATLFKVLLCISSAAVQALSNTSTLKIRKARIHNYEFLLIIYLSIIGMLCLISSYNFLTFYLSIELQSLSFYLLACSKSRSEFSAEAGLKYFILGAFSSAILLFGISLIYGSTGSIYFEDVEALLEFIAPYQKNNVFQVYDFFLSGSDSYPYIGLIVGLVCITISLLFKLAAVPFHMWAPDVYEGSPMNITAFFAITAKIAALAVLARFVMITGQLLIPILLLVSIASLVLGTLSAMRQVKIKRFIAFSGISNVGWFLMGICCGRLDAVILHLIVYIVLSITLFSIIIQPIHTNIDSSGIVLNSPQKSVMVKYMPIKLISDLGNIFKTNTTVALSLTLTFFSLGGIPTLAGFYSKYLIINAAIQAEALVLLTVGLISAILSAFYYIRVVQTIYFSSLVVPTGGLKENWFSFEIGTMNAYLIAFTSFFTTFFIVYPECLIILIDITL